VVVSADKTRFVDSCSLVDNSLCRCIFIYSWRWLLPVLVLLHLFDYLLLPTALFLTNKSCTELKCFYLTTCADSAG